MSKFLRNVDFDKFADESNVQQIKKKGSNPTKSDLDCPASRTMRQ